MALARSEEALKKLLVLYEVDACEKNEALNESRGRQAISAHVGRLGLHARGATSYNSGFTQGLRHILISLCYGKTS